MYFEAYFSTFIEGTEFDVDEAADIVFGNVIPVKRPEDAHDVVGAWQIVLNTMEMARTPRTSEEFIALLQSRHAVMMGARPEKAPGAFKREGNRAGNTIFVASDQVIGMLTRGVDFYRGLEPGFARAVFMMFLVSEVHPFADGNGRVARIMMNAELVANGEERIIIPTLFRSDYLTVLKALSQIQDPTPIVRTLDFAQRWVRSVPWGKLDDTHADLERGNAFMDSVAADRSLTRASRAHAPCSLFHRSGLCVRFLCTCPSDYRCQGPRYRGCEPRTARGSHRIECDAPERRGRQYLPGAYIPRDMDLWQEPQFGSRSAPRCFAGSRR